MNHHPENCFFSKRKSENSFTIRYHKAMISNSFERILYGKVSSTSTSSGIQIDATLRMPTSVIAFVSFWCAFVFIFFLITLLAKPIISLIPLAMLIFCIALVFIFKGNVNKIIDLMNEICK